MSDVDYTVQPAADGSGNVLLLRNADAIITPLATLGRVAQQAAPAAPVEATDTETGAQPAAPTPAEPTTPVTTPAQRTVGTRPSFDCANARTHGERSVCSDAGLAALDRNMAAQYNRAFGVASPEQQSLLRRTRDRFLGYRDRCPDNRCIGDAYVGRMREIRDIMEDRWRTAR